MYVSPVTQMISLDGLSVRMAAGVARPLHPKLVAIALTRGVVAEGDAPAPKVPEPQAEDPVTELTVEVVAQAIRELMADGDKKAFGTTGEPKLAPLRAKAGKDVTDALRDAAWAIVQAEV